MRKLLLLTTALTAIAITTQAQITKGSVLLGGNISAATNKQTYSGNTNEYTQRTFNITPSIGFVTADNKVWGFSLTYGHTSSKSNSTPDDYNYNGYGGGVFHRRYATLGKGFYLFGEANAGYNYSKQKQTLIQPNQDRTIRTDVVYLTVYPGITYAVHKNFHLEVGINNLLRLDYSTQKVTDINGGTGNVATQKNFGFSSNASSANPLVVGFRFVLGK